MKSLNGVAEAANILAQQSTPPQPEVEHQWPAQSLADGAAGVALLHIERARSGTGTWQTAHAWLKAATHHEISAAGTAGLFIGAPSIAFVLHTAGADGANRYAPALARLDPCVTALAHRRVDRALARMARAERPAFAEYDLLHGMTGIGAHLLRHVPGSEALPRILSYLVRLTEPLHADGETLPGWWTFHDPNRRTSPGFPGGHANLGMAHGIAGPLALLAHAQRNGVAVDGQTGAVERICSFLDSWCQPPGTWWPQWVTQHDLRAGRPAQPGPARPSWCYGTPGIARAQQLAAIATGDTPRQRHAEAALSACLADPAQLGQVTDASLCHGWAGIYQTAARAASDALTPHISGHLPSLAAQLTNHAHAAQCQRDGLLEGKTGFALALHTAAHGPPPIPGWDTCLMIS